MAVTLPLTLSLTLTLILTLTLTLTLVQAWDAEREELEERAHPGRRPRPAVKPSLGSSPSRPRSSTPSTRR